MNQPIHTDRPPGVYMAAEGGQEQQGGRVRPAVWRYGLAAVIIVAALVLLTAGLAVGGEPARFVSAGLQFIPLAVLAALAYSGAKHAVAAFFCYVWLAILALGTLLLVLQFTLFALVRDFTAFGQVLNNRDALLRVSYDRAYFCEVFKCADMGGVLLWTLALLGVAALASAAMLLRPVRALVARLIPIDPDNFVHKIALVFLTLATLSSFAPLVALGGRAPLLELMSNEDIQRVGKQAGLEITPLDQLYQFVWMIPTTFIAAGWLIARSSRQTLARLGVVKPTGRQVLAGVVLGVALVVVAGLVLDPAIRRLWEIMGWPTTNEQAFQQIVSKLLTPVGAAVIGVTAGIGEEMAVRGLLQPRLGLVLSNLVFTAAHAFQYNTDALLGVFILGLVLGVVRARSNTTTSAITHGVYDFLAVIGTVLAPPQP